MTTFQDPPPQSRRAVRQSEREESADATVGTPTDAAQMPYTFDPAAAASEPAAAAPTHSSHAPDAAPLPTRGRRAQAPAGPNPQATPAGQPAGYEPLDYATQARPQVPSYDGPSFRNQQPSTPTTSTGEASYRVRDFSPEGRRAALAREHQAAAPAPLDYDTQAAIALAADASATEAPAQPDVIAAAPVDQVPAVSAEVAAAEVPVAEPAPAAEVTAAEVPAAEVPVVDAPVAGSPVAPSAEPGTEHVMSRRELRELREARAAAELAASGASVEPELPEPIFNILNSGPIELPYLLPPAPAPAPSQNLADAMAEFDALTSGEPVVAPAAAPVAPESVVAEPIAAEPVAEAPVPAELTAPEPVAAAPIIAVEPIVDPTPVAAAPLAPPAEGWASAVEPVPSDPEFSDEHVVATPVPDDYVRPVSAFAPDQASEAPTGEAEPVFLQPTPASSRPGHWSEHLDDDDTDADELENTLSRTVGGSSAAITTSALVLPSVPQASDIMSPFTATGEILVTGSIHLPRSLGATGAHPHRVDNSDFEDDPMDNEVISTDSAPVRAIRAVSTHTGTHGVIAARKPQGNRVLTAMIITAGTLALGVLALLVVAFTSGGLGK